MFCKSKLTLVKWILVNFVKHFRIFSQLNKNRPQNNMDWKFTCKYSQIEGCSLIHRTEALKSLPRLRLSACFQTNNWNLQYNKMDMNNGVAAGRKDHVLRFWIRRGLKMNIFPAITLPFYLRLLHLHFGGIKEVENERFNTTKEEKIINKCAGDE